MFKWRFRCVVLFVVAGSFGVSADVSNIATDTAQLVAGIAEAGSGGTSTPAAQVPDWPGALASEVKEMQFLYELPIMPGMERERGKQMLQQNRSDRGIDDANEFVVLRAKQGESIPAEAIVAYYNDVFVNKRGFRAWQQGNDVLSGTFLAPRHTTKGDAHVFSQGSVSFWLPAEGNFIAFWIEHRRDFDFGDTAPLLDAIEAVFAAAAEQSGYRFAPSNAEGFASDWFHYVKSECFVGQRTVGVIFADRQVYHNRTTGDRYRFLLSVFPTQSHAEQWLRKHPRSWLEEGRGEYFFDFPPQVIGNVVIEHRGSVGAPPDAELVATLKAELAKVEQANARKSKIR